MALSSKQIRHIVQVYLQKGQWFHIHDIQNTVSRHHSLTPKDQMPHTQTRPTSYPVWKHRIQSFLASEKHKGLLQHDPTTNSYMF